MTCPHCGAANAAGGSFCVQCGKAVPGESRGPRVVSEEGSAATGAGRRLQTSDLATTAKKAAGALLAVAVIQAVLGTVFVLAAKNEGAADEDVLAGAVTVYGVAALFFGLYVWARKNPLPAAITGLVVFITLHAVEAVLDPSSLAQGFLMKAIVIVVLVRAISAGIKHRQLVRESAAAA